jgi:hypothetical protein
MREANERTSERPGEVEGDVNRRFIRAIRGPTGPLTRRREAMTDHDALKGTKLRSHLADDHDVRVWGAGAFATPIEDDELGELHEGLHQ